MFEDPFNSTDIEFTGACGLCVDDEPAESGCQKYGAEHPPALRRV